jgi:hypothetical protein
MRSVEAVKAALTKARARRRFRSKKARHWTEKLVESQKRVTQLEQELEAAKNADIGARALMEAGRLVGVMESGGNNRGPVVEKITRYALGTVGEPWCVNFNIWCYGHAGSQFVKPGYTRAVRYMFPHDGLIQTSSPRPGDMVRFSFDHTGLFVKDNGNGTITTIEGNTGASGAVSDSATGGDGVYRKVRSKSLVRDYLRVRG